ncbi:carboxymethylenebutenolidase [Exophiala viscosa]|uniref:Carboxymethylenebutenolidase n=1 Tax=Exophiala viscosa TaxID=2486360 RepID=A0AAN6DPA8_9EURO|nr:carboxymethylenebutenolidase [Exophiala viscosa]
MVRIELGGKPIIDVDAVPGDSARLKEHVRRKIRGSGRAVNLGWNKTIPRLVLTSDTDDFDPTTIQHFKEEGFQMSYLAYTGKKASYTEKLQHLQDPLELGEKYAIVAYGDAAALVLEACMKPMPKLVAVVAYYPPYMPRTTTNFPPTLNVQIHLASSQKFGTKHPSYRYSNTKPGFAEYDLDEFDKVSASLAWSRTLTVLREAFDMEPPDLEAIWDSHMRLSFSEKNVDKTMATMVDQPYVNHIPTMTGGIGHDELRRFYDEFFIPNNPADLRIKLLSRTIGVDRIVDEMFVNFTHTTDMPWMLPGVPPTNKKVEVVLVSVVCVRGGKLFHEHVHWDQASVLVQVGLIDPKYIPDTFKTADQGREDEVERLPVVGREAARKVLDEDSSRSNKLIPEW